MRVQLDSPELAGDNAWGIRKFDNHDLLSFVDSQSVHTVWDILNDQVVKVISIRGCVVGCQFIQFNLQVINNF